MTKIEKQEIGLSEVLKNHIEFWGNKEEELTGLIDGWNDYFNDSVMLDDFDIDSKYGIGSHEYRKGARVAKNYKNFGYKGVVCWNCGGHSVTGIGYKVPCIKCNGNGWKK